LLGRRCISPGGTRDSSAESCDAPPPFLEKEAAPDAPPFIALIAWTAALGSLAQTKSASQEDERIEKPPSLLEQSWPAIREGRARLPSFVGDTAFTVRLRTGFIEAQTTAGLERRELAAGGWLAYRSGWLLNALQIGATSYGAAPVYAPPGKDGLLLMPGENAYYVFGEAFAAARYEEYALLKGYRQEVQQPYINRADNKMTPNTFQGVTVAGKISSVNYFAGYISRIKPRNADQFIAMSEAAGAPRTNYGVALLGATLKPLPGLSVEMSEQYGVNTFNTLFARMEHVRPLAPDVHLQVGGQFTDQRAVGRALVATTQVKKWSTQHAAARVALTYQDLTVKTAAAITTSGNKIQSPWGFYPGYHLMIQQFFNNAREKALLVGAAYDFSRAIVPGLSAYTNLAWGLGSMNPVKRTALGGEWEYDLTVEYRPPPIRGLLFRMRGAIHDLAGVDRVGYFFRFGMNWELPLL
jgi:outer membrane OprD family porin